MTTSAHHLKSPHQPTIDLLFAPCIDRFCASAAPTHSCTTRGSRSRWTRSSPWARHLACSWRSATSSLEARHVARTWTSRNWRRACRPRAIWSTFFTHTTPSRIGEELQDLQVTRFSETFEIPIRNARIWAPHGPRLLTASRTDEALTVLALWNLYPTEDVDF